MSINCPCCGKKLFDSDNISVEELFSKAAVVVIQIDDDEYQRAVCKSCAKRILAQLGL